MARPPFVIYVNMPTYTELPKPLLRIGNVNFHVYSYNKKGRKMLETKLRKKQSGSCLFLVSMHFIEFAW